MAKEATAAKKTLSFSSMKPWTVGSYGRPSCWWTAGGMNIEWKEADMQIHINYDSLVIDSLGYLLFYLM